jgi:hypothetical protein
MRKTTPIHTLHIRFKRWSRKNYSIFCSLKREVNIGVLAKNILDISFEKSNICSFIHMNIASSGFFNDEKDEHQSTSEKLYPAHNTAPALADAFSPGGNVKYYQSAENGYN